MMNMMNRFVEGRGHEREIDMLLELTYVDSLCFVQSCPSLMVILFSGNKLKDAQYVLWVTLLRGRYKVS